MGVLNSVAYDRCNYMDAAFAPVVLENYRIAHKNTWGHLAPEQNKTYRGYIVFTLTVYGDMTIIDSDFGELPDSPWLFDAMNEFVFDDRSLPEGAVFRWEGTFRNYRFNGTQTVIYRR